MWAARLTGLATVDGLGAFACYNTRASRFSDSLMIRRTYLRVKTITHRSK